jgi:co-chaperonin GroES (HSP10)
MPQQPGGVFFPDMGEEKEKKTTVPAVAEATDGEDKQTQRVNTMIKKRGADTSHRRRERWYAQVFPFFFLAV